MTIPTFPSLAGLAYPVLRRPIMSTQKLRSVNNKVTALQMASYPIWGYELPYSVLRSASPQLEWETLVAFFLELRGAARLFQYQDVDDYAVTDQGLGVGDGVTTDYQLLRTLTGGGFSFVEPVFAPVAITDVKIDGVATAAYTLEDAGVIRFDAAPANSTTLTWTGTYNWLCRFDEDVQEFEKFADKFWRLKKITFTTEAL